MNVLHCIIWGGQKLDMGDWELIRLHGSQEAGRVELANIRDNLRSKDDLNDLSFDCYGIYGPVN